MTKLPTYTYKGTKGADTVGPSAWQEKVNKALLAQAIFIYNDRRHPGLSKSKTRGEVTRTTKKIYKQKGTGNARHGAKSAPIFVGGGTAHGPHGTKRVLSLPRTMRMKALQSAFAAKVKEGKVVVVEDVVKCAKTKDVQTFISALVTDKNKKATVVLADANWKVSRFVRNIKNVSVEKYSALNAYKVYYGGTILVDSAALEKKKEQKNEKTEKVEKEIKKTVKKTTKAKK